MLATHDVELAAEVATRVVVVAEGETVADGAAAEILVGSPMFAPAGGEGAAPPAVAHGDRGLTGAGGGVVTLVGTARPARHVTVVPLGARSLASLLVASAVGVMAFGWPLLASPGSQVVAHAKDAPWLFALLLPLVLAVVLARGRRRRPRRQGHRDARVLAAVTAALRPLGGGTAGFEPMWIVLVLGGRVLGPRLRILAGRHRRCSRPR